MSRKEEHQYFVNWRKVGRNEFMKEAAMAGATDVHSARWGAFHDENGTLMNCDVGGSVFITFRTGRPRIN